ncbi:hypothetical protein [uncultured Rhodoblastus sp.]|uniref:hypothetical protein n=1 Tax=uncultured Rhodoblastus sp. TaxID=543037 RepID=UPI0025D8311E|nr:hypothetical protein [uncultured Rhodoblastus sp.]
MSADYLDLLLARETRAAPLAEPRIASGATPTPIDPAWGETVEERLVERAGADAPARLGAERPAARSERDPPVRNPPPPAVERREPPQTVAWRETPPAPPAQPEPIARERSAAERSDPPPFIETRILETDAPPRPQDAQDARPAPSADALFPRARQDAAAPRAPAPARLFEPAERASAPPAPPPIRISIDRVEVRAAGAAPSAPAAPRPRERPRVTLDDYLARRDGGGR